MSEKIRKFMRGEKGFTLIEMMVVLIIIAVLIGAGIRAYMGYIGRAKITKATGDISTMAAALDSYYQTQRHRIRAILTMLLAVQVPLQQPA